jgi:hypothetical protein
MIIGHCFQLKSTAVVTDSQGITAMQDMQAICCGHRAIPGTYCAICRGIENGFAARSKKTGFSLNSGLIEFAYQFNWVP